MENSSSRVNNENRTNRSISCKQREKEEALRVNKMQAANMKSNNVDLSNKEKEIAMIEMQEFDSNTKIDDDLPKCKQHIR